MIMRSRRSRLGSSPALVAGILAAAGLAGCSEEAPPPLYMEAQVARRDIVVSVSAAGAIEPVTTVDVKSKASGEVMAMPVETGDQVRPGQLLVRVDPRAPRNALDQAEANLEVAKAEVDNTESRRRRAQELFKSQGISEQEYEAVELEVAKARAQLVGATRALEDARIAFEDTEVRAPSSGMILAKNVEVGTVISSATREVGGGTVLLQMANLDTVQVRTLVDETDIGKIKAGLGVTTTVDAYPNQPFEGNVLKIEPMATVEQNVTMFPVLIRIPNPSLLLRPGMNAEVEIHVGERRNVLTVPNAALRTPKDLASAAQVLGLDPAAVEKAVADAKAAADSSSRGDSASAASAPAGEAPGRETMTLPDGRTVELPEGLTAARVRAVFQKMRDGGGPQALSGEDQAVFQRFRAAMGSAKAAPRSGGADYLFGGNYIVFVMRGEQAAPVPIRTGLTDLDHSEVVTGLGENDTVLILPSASLVASQKDMQERISRVRGTGLPGVQRQNASGSSGGNR